MYLKLYKKQSHVVSPSLCVFLGLEKFIEPCNETDDTNKLYQEKDPITIRKRRSSRIFDKLPS